MSTRTRLWLLIAAAILIAYPLAAWIIGFIVQQQVQASEQAALRQAGPYLTIVEHTYRRGVFAATELVSVGFDTKALKSSPAPGAQALSSFRLTVRNTIHHGPFPGGRTFALATIDTELVLPPKAQKRLDTLFAGRRAYTLRTSLGWWGGRQSEFSSPPFSGEVAAGTTLSSAGIAGTATVTRNQLSTTLELAAKGLSVQSSRFQAQLDDLHFKSALQRSFGALNLGDASLVLSRVEVKSRNPEDAPVSLQTVEITSHSSAVGDYISYDGKLASGPMQVARFTATQEQYEFIGTHLYGPALAGFMNSIRSIGGASSAAFNPRSVQQLQQQIGAAMRKDGVDLLLHEPVFEIPHFDFATPEGAFSLSARVTAPGLKREDLEGGRPAVIAALVQHLDAKADLKVDTGLLDKLTEGTPGNGDRLATAARQLEAQGYIAQEGTALVTHVTFNHGKLSLNGKAFPPSRAPQPP